MSWDRVNDWVTRLRQADLSTIDSPLSKPGLQAVWQAALDALHPDALAQAGAMPGQPYHSATLIPAATVVTAPLEWCAVLLGRGTRVTLKVSSRVPGAAQLLAASAADVGLPLRLTHSRQLPGAELVVALGSDETMQALRAAVPDSTCFVGHGHAFSVAWVRDDWQAVAEDAALHDGRGCLSPIWVLTPTPLAQAVPALAAAMAQAQRRWPRGAISAIEGAQIRSRAALARATTGHMLAGKGWSVHGLLAAHAQPQAMPRAIAVLQVDEAAARTLVEPWRRWLSSVGAQEHSPLPWGRITPLGTMQRPALRRLHDGRDWLAETLRQPE